MQQHAISPWHRELNRLLWRVEKQWQRRDTKPNPKSLKLKRVVLRVRAFVARVRADPTMRSDAVRAGVRRLTRELDGV